MATDLYAVIGKPIYHSQSPQMHNAAFKELGIDAQYIRLASESAQGALRTAKAMGIRGMNVTAPFKEDMAALVREQDGIARKLGAINTIIFENGIARGFNTDPDGVLGAFKAARAEVKGRNAVVLGAGGAARAAVLALQRANAGKITIINRTLEKAQRIAGEFGCGFCALSGCEGAVRGAGLLVSALSTPQRVLDPMMLHDKLIVLDAHYSSQSALSLDAQAAGCRVIGGREWLLHQGTGAFGLFCGKRAPIRAMRKALYAQNSKPKTQNPEREAQNPEPASRNIALIGMMGSGKDSVARALAKKSGMRIIDADAEIERSAGMEIREIFAKEGEEGFRRRESKALASFQGAENSIINCGGGAVIKTHNRKTLKRAATVVWLWADTGTILARVPKDGRRPLLDGPEPEKRLNELLAKRVGAYAEASDLAVDTEGRTPQEIAGRILYEIH